jgi:hypothetical protein
MNSLSRHLVHRSLPVANGLAKVEAFRRRRMLNAFVRSPLTVHCSPVFSKSYLKNRIFVRDQELPTPEEPRPPVEASSKPSMRTAEISAKRLF